MSTESSAILIIGAGVAGCVLAIGLHQQGYKVILFEKYNGPAPGGASLNLAPNGLRVLDTFGLAKPLFSREIAAPVELISHRTDEELLVESSIASRMAENFGFPFAGVKRSVFLQYLLDCAQEEGVDIRFGYALKSIDQNETSVLATFENGQQITGSILVGCDGLHSPTRSALFGREIPQYSGLTQTAGMALVPHHHRKMQNIYGDNVHVISYAVGTTGSSGGSLISWAVTRQEEEGRESWKSESSDSFREKLLDQLDFEWDNGISVKDLVTSSPAIVKFGLYDRKELHTWHKNRVVLLGDAAHPTAPHLGQGANQALEDVKALIDLFVIHLPPSNLSAINIPNLETVLNALNEQRIPRTSSLVAQAREAGRRRVLPSHSVEAKERKIRLKEDWTREDRIILQMYEVLLGLRLSP